MANKLDATIEFKGYHVELEIFEGPLDLLLYLIKRDEVDIYDIPIGYITDQYLNHLRGLLGQFPGEEKGKSSYGGLLLDIDSAGEFLVMASTLLYMKSQMLLPQPSPILEEEGKDPRVELAEMLSEYQRYKETVTFFRSCEENRQHLFTHPTDSVAVSNGPSINIVEISVVDLLKAVENLVKRRSPRVQELRREIFSVAEKIRDIKSALLSDERIPFDLLLPSSPCRMEIIATFLALLEVVRQRHASFQQHRLFETIYICRPPLHGLTTSTEEEETCVEE